MKSCREKYSCVACGMFIPHSVDEVVRLHSGLCDPSKPFYNLRLSLRFLPSSVPAQRQRARLQRPNVLGFLSGQNGRPRLLPETLGIQDVFHRCLGLFYQYCFVFMGDNGILGGMVSKAMFLKHLRTGSEVVQRA